MQARGGASENHKAWFWTYQRPPNLQRVFNLYYPTVFTACTCNVLQAVVRRLAIPLNTPDLILVKFLKKLARRLSHLGHGHGHNFWHTFHKKKGKDQRKFVRGVNEILLEGFESRDNTHEVISKTELGEPKSFTQDHYSNSDLGRTRLIFNFSEKLAALGSIYYPPVEEMVLHLEDPTGDIALPRRCALKGLNSTERAELLMEHCEAIRDPIYMFADGSSCDVHMQAPLLRVQHAFDFAHCTDPFFCELQNRSTKKQRIKYKNPHGSFVTAVLFAMRLTGTHDTGGGNTFIHIAILLLVWLASSRHPLAIRWLGDYLYSIPFIPKEFWTFLVDGDDLGIIAEKPISRALRASVDMIVESLGHEFKWDPYTDEIRNTTLCRCNPIRVDGKWVMIRRPQRALSNFFACETFFDKSQLLPYLKTVCIGEAQIFSGVPVMSVLYETIIASLPEVGLYKGELKELERKKKDYRRPGLPITPESREDFEVAFGISISDQLLCEEEIKNFNWHYVSGAGMPSPIETFAENFGNYDWSTFRNPSSFTT